MRGEPVKNPRRIGEHVRLAYEYLQEHGAEEIRVYKTTHIIIAFRMGTHELEVRTSGTPRDAGNAFGYFLRDLKTVAAKALVGA